MSDEFRVIDAQHRVYQQMQAEIVLLRILLREAKGRISLKDKWKVQDICEKYPQLASSYEIIISSML